MANWGALAAGIGAGYLAADGWKKKKEKDKDKPSEPGATVHRGYGGGYGVEASTGPGDAAENYANGGLVTGYGGQGCGVAGVNRWMGKKLPK